MVSKAAHKSYHSNVLKRLNDSKAAFRSYDSNVLKRLSVSRVAHTSYDSNVSNVRAFLKPHARVTKVTFQTFERF